MIFYCQLFNMKPILKTIIAGLTASCFYSTASAQLTVSAQLRTRTEYRDGLGAPLPKDANPALFTSQRTRLSAGFSTYRLKLGIAIQDVRVWGQDGSTINRTTTQDNNGLMLHEAWAEIGLTDTSNKRYSMALKLGRQEIIYDDERLMGNLDWPQPARRHDAALLQFNSNRWMVHAGFAFNQNKENVSDTKYNPTPAGNYAANTNGGSMYKSFEYLYADRKYEQGNVSFIFFSDQFSKYHNDMANDVPVKVWDDGTWTRFTTGFYTTNNFNKINFSASAYYQFGENASGEKLSAALLSANAFYKVNKKFSVGPGIDYTTGGSTGNKSNAFDPLYGTPHKFWGLMDYFYAGSGFGNKGLIDYYLKAKYTASSSFAFTAGVHQFNSSSPVYNNNDNLMNRNFGTEADVNATYTLTKIISFEAGYSHFFSTASLASPGVKNITNAQSNNNWAYLMIKIQPSFILSSTLK